MIPDSIWHGELRAPTRDAAEELWCRLVARGRIVGRAHDGSRPLSLRLHLALVEHPDLPAGEVYALFFMGDATPKVYRTTAEDARIALHDPGPSTSGEAPPRPHHIYFVQPPCAWPDGALICVHREHGAPDEPRRRP